MHIGKAVSKAVPTPIELLVNFHQYKIHYEIQLSFYAIDSLRADFHRLRTNCTNAD